MSLSIFLANVFVTQFTISLFTQIHNQGYITLCGFRSFPYGLIKHIEINFREIYTFINFISIDLKNKENIKITFTKDLEEQYLKKLTEITNKIEAHDNFLKKTGCKCEYSPICF